MGQLIQLRKDASIQLNCNSSMLSHSIQALIFQKPNFTSRRAVKCWSAACQTTSCVSVLDNNQHPGVNTSFVLRIHSSGLSRLYESKLMMMMIEGPEGRGLRRRRVRCVRCVHFLIKASDRKRWSEQKETKRWVILFVQNLLYQLLLSAYLRTTSLMRILLTGWYI